MPRSRARHPRAPARAPPIGAIALKRCVTAIAPAANAACGLAASASVCPSQTATPRETQSSISSSAPGSSGASVTVLTGPAASSRSSSGSVRVAQVLDAGARPAASARGTAPRGGRRRSARPPCARRAAAIRASAASRSVSVARDQRRLIRERHRRAEAPRPARRAPRARRRGRRPRRNRSPARRRAQGSRGPCPGPPARPRRCGRPRSRRRPRTSIPSTTAAATPSRCSPGRPGPGRPGSRPSSSSAGRSRPRWRSSSVSRPSGIGPAYEHRGRALRASTRTVRAPRAPARAATPAISATIRVARSRSFAFVARRSTISPPKVLPS